MDHDRPSSYTLTDYIFCEVKDIAKEIQLTSFVIEELGTIFKQDESSTLLSKNALRTADETVQECSSVFAELEVALKKSKKNTLGRLMLPFRDNKIELLRSHIDKLKSTLQLLMQVLTHAYQIAAHKIDRETEAKQREQIKALLDNKNKLTRRYEESLKNYSISEDSNLSDDDEPEKARANPAIPVSLNTLMTTASSSSSSITTKNLETCVRHIQNLLEDLETLQNAINSQVDDHSEHEQSLIGSYFRARGHLDSVLFGSTQGFKSTGSMPNKSGLAAHEPSREIGIELHKTWTGSTMQSIERTYSEAELNTAVQEALASYKSEERGKAIKEARLEAAKPWMSPSNTHNSNASSTSYYRDQRRPPTSRSDQRVNRPEIIVEIGSKRYRNNKNDSRQNRVSSLSPGGNRRSSSVTSSIGPNEDSKLESESLRMRAPIERPTPPLTYRHQKSSASEYIQSPPLHPLDCTEFSHSSYRRGTPPLYDEGYSMQAGSDESDSDDFIVAVPSSGYSHNLTYGEPGSKLPAEASASSAGTVFVPSPDQPTIRTPWMIMNERRQREAASQQRIEAEVRRRVEKERLRRTRQSGKPVGGRSSISLPGTSADTSGRRRSFDMEDEKPTIPPGVSYHPGRSSRPPPPVIEIDSTRLERRSKDREELRERQKREAEKRKKETEVQQPEKTTIQAGSASPSGARNSLSSRLFDPKRKKSDQTMPEDEDTWHDDDVHLDSDISRPEVRAEIQRRMILEAEAERVRRETIVKEMDERGRRGKPEYAFVRRKSRSRSRSRSRREYYDPRGDEEVRLNREKQLAEEERSLERDKQIKMEYRRIRKELQEQKRQRDAMKETEQASKDERFKGEEETRREELMEAERRKEKEQYLRELRELEETQRKRIADLEVEQRKHEEEERRLEERFENNLRERREKDLKWTLDPDPCPQYNASVPYLTEMPASSSVAPRTAPTKEGYRIHFSSNDGDLEDFDFDSFLQEDEEATFDFLGQPAGTSVEMVSERGKQEPASTAVVADSDVDALLRDWTTVLD